MQSVSVASPVMYPPPWLPTQYHFPNFIDPTNGGLHPFRLCFIKGNISVCHGCKNHYSKEYHEICIQHEEWRSFTPPGGSVPQSRFGNVYYHVNVFCVQINWPSFNPASLVTSDEINAQLEPAQKTILEHFLGSLYY